MAHSRIARGSGSRLGVARALRERDGGTSDGGARTGPCGSEEECWRGSPGPGLGEEGTVTLTLTRRWTRMDGGSHVSLGLKYAWVIASPAWGPRAVWGAERGAWGAKKRAPQPGALGATKRPGAPFDGHD